MPLPDHVATDFRFRSANIYVASFRLYWTVDAGSLTASNANQLADALQAAFDGLLIPCLTGSCDFLDVKLRYTNGGTEVEGASTELPVAGTATGETLPEHDAVVIRRKTGTVGRARRGRIFFPFVPEDFVNDEGQLSTGGHTAYAAFATKLNENFVSAGTGITLVPVQPVPSLNLLLPVTRVEVVQSVRTRRDRQRENEIVSIVA